MTRAEVVFQQAVAEPRAVLVLCPGANGDGSGMVRLRAWREFAERERLGLAGIRFESPAGLLRECRGYYRAAEGSGAVLLEAVSRRYGKELPLLMFGFSGGAHFTTRFVAWRPERVQGWCALGAGVLDRPLRGGPVTRGLMASGDDDPRLGGALMFFQQGRAAGNPWLWMCLPGVGHASTPQFERFAREYFSALLANRNDGGVWVDIDRGSVVGKGEADRWPGLSGWLPDRALLGQWKAGHEHWTDRTGATEDVP